MDIGVLGPLEVRRDQTAVRLGAPKLRGLLLSLVLDVGRVVPAHRLIDELWTDDPPPQPLVSLRSYISNLRRLLQEPDAPPVIGTRAGGYALDIDPQRIDANRFEFMAREGRAALVDSDPALALDRLSGALALWRGEALADVAGEPFARPTIAKLEELRLTASEDRFDALLELGHHLEVAPELEAFVARQPLRERAVRQLMLALYRCGRITEALDVGATHRRTLVEHYGLDPGPMLSELTNRILRQDPGLEVVVAEVVRSIPVVQPPSRSAPPSLSTVVGRRSERGHLAAAVDAVAAGTGGSLLVAGEPGIGKTALLQELTQLAAARNIPAVWGRCLEQAGAPAFWPWLEVVRTVTAALDEDALTAALSGSAAPVTQLAPELAARAEVPVTTATGDADTARFLLYDAVATFLGRVAVERGLVVILDDLHWADAPSLQLLTLLAPRAPASRILVAASYRDATSHQTPELEAALAVVAREASVPTLQLRPLAPDDVAELVASVTRRPEPSEVLSEVYRRAGGNPFFVRQLAALAAEVPLDAPDPLAEPAEARRIPLGVRHVLRRRLQQLPSSVLGTLQCAAVFGQSFDVRVVATATGIPIVAALDHVDTAISHGLVEVAGDHASAYRFVHGLVRETLEDDLAAGVAARLHAAAASALESLGAVPAEAVAEHLWRAGDLVGDERTVRFLRAAADEAMAVFAYERAEEQLNRALHVLARAEDDPATELAVRLRLLQVLTGRLYGWTATAREQISGRVRSLAGRAGTDAELVPLWWSLWTTMMTRGDLPASRELADELLGAAARHGDPASSVAGNVAMAYTELFSGAPATEVLDLIDRAAAAERAADPADLSRTPEHLGVSLRATRAMTHAVNGDAVAAAVAVETLLDHAIATAHPFQEAYARMFAAWAASLIEDTVAAHQNADQGLARCEEGGFSSLAQLTVAMHAWSSARLGADPGDQAARIANALECLEAAGQAHAMTHWYGLLAETRLLAGDRAGAQEALERALELERATGEAVYRPVLARIGASIAVPVEPAEEPGGHDLRPA